MFKSNKSNSLITRYFIPTTLRVMMAEWTHLAQFIIQHGKAIKDKIGKDTDKNAPIPSDEQLNNVLNGPYQAFVSQCLNIQGRISRVRIAHQIKESDLFPDDQHPNNPNEIPENVLKNSNLAECDSLSRKVDEVCQEHINAWHECIKQWPQEIIAQLAKNDLSLSEIESKELADDEPMPDIIERFNEQKMEIPALPNKMGFSTYYKLKASFAVSSLLARLHQPNTSKDIDKQLKPLGQLWSSIQKQEEQLLSTQNAELKLLIQAIDYEPKKEKA